MFSFSGTAASGQKLPLWSTFLLPVNENWVVSLCKSCAKKKKRKKICPFHYTWKFLAWSWETKNEIFIAWNNSPLCPCWSTFRLLLLALPGPGVTRPLIIPSNVWLRLLPTGVSLPVLSFISCLKNYFMTNYTV